MVRSAADLALLVQLPLEERLELVHALWASIRATPDAVPVTAAERMLIAERRAEFARDPDAVLTWESVRAELWADQEADDRAAVRAEDSDAEHEGGDRPA